MKKTIVVTLLCAAMMAAADLPPTEKGIRDAVAMVDKAAREGNRSVIEGALADGIIYGHSNAKLENKAEAVQGLVTGKPNFVWSPGMTVQMYGKTAVVAGKAVAHNARDGQTTQIPLHILQVWAHDGKTWKMVARHTTRLP
jgi:hypothetical protein